MCEAVVLTATDVDRRHAIDRRFVDARARVPDDRRRVLKSGQVVLELHRREHPELGRSLDVLDRPQYLCATRVVVRVEHDEVAFRVGERLE